MFNYFAQMLSRSVDLETGRTYDIQMLYSKMKQYAHTHGFSYDTTKGALDAILYLYQVVENKALVINLIRNTKRVEELLGWHNLSPDQLAKAFQNVTSVPAAATATPQEVEALAYSVLGRTPSGLSLEEALKSSSAVQEFKQLFENIIKNRPDLQGFELIGQFLKGDQQNHLDWGIVAKLADQVLVNNVATMPALRAYLQKSGVIIHPETKASQDADGRSVMDASAIKSLVDDAMSRAETRGEALDKLLNQSGITVRVWTAYYLFRDHYADPVVRSALAQFDTGAGAYDNLVKLAGAVLQVYPGDTNGSVSEPMLRGIFEAIAKRTDGTPNDVQSRIGLLDRIMKEDKTKEPDGLSRTIAARVWSAMMWQWESNGALKTHLQSNYLKATPATLTDLIEGVYTGVIPNQESIFALTELPSAEALQMQGQLPSELMVTVPSGKDQLSNDPNVKAYVVLGARRTGYSSESSAYDLSFGLHNHPTHKEAGTVQVLPSGRWSGYDGLFQAAKKENGKFVRKANLFINTELGITRYSVVNEGEPFQAGTMTVEGQPSSIPVTKEMVEAYNSGSASGSGELSKLAYAAAREQKSFTIDFVDGDLRVRYEFKPWNVLAEGDALSGFVTDNSGKSMIQPIAPEVLAIRSLFGKLQGADLNGYRLHFMQDRGHFMLVGGDGKLVPDAGLIVIPTFEKGQMTLELGAILPTALQGRKIFSVFAKKVADAAPENTLIMGSLAHLPTLMGLTEALYPDIAQRPGEIQAWLKEIADSGIDTNLPAFGQTDTKTGDPKIDRIKELQQHLKEHLINFIKTAKPAEKDAFEQKAADIGVIKATKEAIGVKQVSITVKFIDGADRLVFLMPAQPARSELRTAKPVAAVTTPATPTLLGAEAAMVKPVVPAEVKDLAARLGNAEIKVPIAYSTPSQDSRLPKWGVGYFAEDTKSAVINASAFEMPMTELERTRANYQLAFGVVHENDHFLHPELWNDALRLEMRAYLATAEAMEKALAEVVALGVDMEYAGQLRAQIDLIQRWVNFNQPGLTDEQKQEMAIQIITGNMAVGRRFDELLLSSISGKMIVVSERTDDAFAKLLGVPVTNASALAAATLKAPYPQHTSIAIRRADLKNMSPGMLEALGRYKTRGFSIVLIQDGTAGEAVVMRSLAALTLEAMQELLRQELPTEQGFIDGQKAAEMKAMEFIISMFVTEQQVAVAA